MSKRGDWMAMAEVVPDEVVDEVTVTAPLDTLGAAVRAKYDGRSRSSRVLFQRYGSAGTSAHP